jgi:hypothetical protein
MLKHRRITVEIPPVKQEPLVLLIPEDPDLSPRTGAVKRDERKITVRFEEVDDGDYLLTVHAPV